MWHLGRYVEGQGHSMSLHQNHIWPITWLFAVRFNNCFWQTTSVFNTYWYKIFCFSKSQPYLFYFKWLPTYSCFLFGLNRPWLYVLFITGPTLWRQAEENQELRPWPPNVHPSLASEEGVGFTIENFGQDPQTNSQVRHPRVWELLVWNSTSKRSHKFVFWGGWKCIEAPELGL